MAEAARVAERLRDPDGEHHVLRVEHMRAMKDGAVLGELGPFQCRDRSDGLKQAAQGPTRVREFVDEWRLGGKRVFVLGRRPDHQTWRRRRATRDVMDMFVRESGARC